MILSELSYRYCTLTLLFSFLCFTPLGCTTYHAPIVSVEKRIAAAHHLVKMAKWHAYTIPSTGFTLKAFGSPTAKKVAILTIYIEGDGLAWLSEDRPSANPTPIVPTALKMALQDTQMPVAYLARPCQFVGQAEWQHCQRQYWTERRFSPEIISAMNQAITYLKNHYHAQHIRLIGYSGGGTVATLVAARRSDVCQLITVAAILDTDYWVQQESLTPLRGSLNPANAWKNLVDTPQIHWVGGKDTVVKKEVAYAYTKRFPAAKKPKIIVMPTFDHSCCWDKHHFYLVNSK
jgi:dienelactone hydrolase